MSRVKLRHTSRSIVANIERGRLEEKEASARTHAKQVAEANLAQIKALIAKDVEILRLKLPGPQDARAEHALDMKYLRDRQQNPGADLCHIQ